MFSFFSSSFGNQWLGLKKQIPHFDADTYTNGHPKFFAICLDEKRAMFEGIPVGLSLVARRLEEEKVVAMLQLITDVAGLHHV